MWKGLLTMATLKLPKIETTIESVLKRGQGYPDVKWLAEYRGITQQEAYDAIIKHSAETNWGALAMDKPPLPPAPEKITHAEKKIASSKSNDNHIHDLPKEILRGVFGILSIIAGIRSWGFVYNWFAQWDSGFFSVIMATILTGAMIALPQAAIIFKREKRYVMLTISALIILFSVLFSMATTVAGLYNDRSKLIHAQSLAQASNKGNSEEVARLEKRGQEISADKAMDARELEALQDKIKPYQPGTMEYNRISVRIDNIKKRIDGYSNTIRLIQDRIDSKITDKSYVIEREDFFSYLESVSGIKKNEAEFGVSIIVSVIVDIAGPVFATIALFL